MNKVLVSAVVMALCVSLCACGGANAPDNGERPNTPDHNNASTQTMEEKLAGDWQCLNNEFVDNLRLEVDGSTSNNKMQWSVEGNIVVLEETQDDGTTKKVEYVLRCLDGWYVMVGDNKTYGQIPTISDVYTDISVTADNWQEYFEFGTYTYTQRDAFGDPVGEKISYHLRLKAEYFQRLLSWDSTVMIRFSQNKTNGQAYTTDLECQTRGWSGEDFVYYGIYIDDPSVHSFEMLRIEGTIRLLNLK